MSVSRFPFEKTVAPLPNDARLEWLYLCLDGHPNVTKKRIITLAVSTDVGFLDHQQATVLIDTLGLKEI